MDDIIEIYDPIYRETPKMILYFLIILGITIIILAIFYINKKIQKNKKLETPESLYIKAITNFTDLYSQINIISTKNFTEKVTHLYKKYLTVLLNYDFQSKTNDEMILKLKSTTDLNEMEISNYFLNLLEPSQFGKYEISENNKKSIIKFCIDSITSIYTAKIGENSV